MGNVKLIAKTNVKFGGKGERTSLGLVRTEEATTVAPGEEFEIDDKSAEELVLVGAAMLPDDYRAEQKAKETTEDKVARMREEIAEHDLATKAEQGDSAAITSNAHLAAQKREEEAIAEAQKKGKAKTKSDEDDDDKKSKKK